MQERRSKEKVIDLIIYTDGSCKKRGQSMTFGGWAFVAYYDEKEIHAAAGSECETTNQRMELTAIVEALEYASATRRPSERVVIYSDSAYAINCCQQEWYIKWQENGWINSKNEPVANQDLWEKIIPYFDNFWYDFRKITGHAGNHGNEKVDELAQSVAEKLKTEWRGNENE